MVYTSRERVERTINFTPPDRLPFNFWMDRGRMAELERRHGPNFRIRHYGTDVWESMVFPDFPTGRFETRSNSEWMVEPAFRDWREAASLPMPDPHDPKWLDELRSDLVEFRDKAVIADMPSVLTAVERMKSQEELYIDIATDPEPVLELFERISNVMQALAEQVARLDVTAMYVMDDIGGNNGLLISPRMIREFVVPHWRKVIDIAHAHNKPVFFHTDGNISAAWPIFEELGVRMLNPLQPGLQDLGEFKTKYHGKMGCYGGLDTGRIHTMTPEEIRNHVRDLFEKVGGGGGLIASTHDLDQSITEEQLDALVNAIKACTY